MAQPSQGIPTEAGSPGSQAVVPRWEWRFIGRSLPVDRARLHVTRGDAPTSRETYLLSALTPHNIKVRNAMLEIKRLEEHAADGVELWRPTARSAFPLESAAGVELWEAWGIATPAQVTAVTSLADLVRDVVSRHPALRRVDLVKRRNRLTLAGCNGEIVELEIMGEHWVSVAFEDADPALVRAAVAASGLNSQDNQNYPAALKRIVGLPVPVPAVEGV